MGYEVAESVELPYNCTTKVHRLMCLELEKLIHRISRIYSDIESARPRCASGIDALCSFHVAVDKAKLLIQFCSECSKLYLAITADRIQLRFERVRNTLELCLSQIRSIVPSLLGAQISAIIHDLRNAKFPLEPSEDEAGKKMIALLQHDIPASGSINQLELEALQLAALRLNINSPLALLIEKRSIKRLLEKICDTDTVKKKVLKYLLFLLRKYGELIWQCKTEEFYHQSSEAEADLNKERDEIPVDKSDTVLEPPEEFKCPMSMRLMYDPVVVASGKTFERVWIEKWFNDGHKTCPKTHLRLDNFFLTSNLAMKGLISKWCLEHGISISEPPLQSKPNLLSSRKASSSSSVVSFGSSIDNLCLHISNASFRSSDTDHSLNPSNYKTNGSKLSQTNQCPTTRLGVDLSSLSKLAIRPWGSQCDVVENVKKQLKENDQPCHLAFSNSYVKPLIKFLKDAHDLQDVKAQKDGAEVLLAVLIYSRDEMPLIHEDEIYTLASFLDSEITEKALAITEVLSRQQCYKSGFIATGIIPCTLKILNTGISKLHELAIMILCNLSCNDDIVYHMVYLDCIPKLVRLFEDPLLARYCIKILKVLCTSVEGRTAVAETSLCITSIATLLETATKEEQEHLVDILLSLCHERSEYCQLTMTESIIQCLADISLNGNSSGKETAKELLMLLEHSKEGDASECLIPDAALSPNMSHDSASRYKENRKSSTAPGFLGKKILGLLHVKH